MSSVLAAEGGYQEFTLGGAEWAILIFALVSALIAIAVGFVLMNGVLKKDQGTPKMQEIARAIQEGASAYLKRQFKTIAMILVPLAIVVFLTSVKVVKPNETVALSYGALRHRSHPGLHRRLPDVRADRIHRHDAGHPGQRAHRRGGQDRVHARSARHRVPDRRRSRDVHRRPRPLRRHGHHHDLPEHRHRRS